jgi:hypothetical protein
MLWGDVIGYVFFAIESDRANQQYEMGLFRNGGILKNNAIPCRDKKQQRDGIVEGN